jgi:hypothetical protein
MAPGSSKFGTDAMSAPVAGTPKASEAKPFTPFSSTAASSSPAKPATENWQPNAPDTRADPTATRPLGNPPLRTAGPFPPQGAASPGPETRGKAPDMMPPTRYHEPEQPPRKRRKVLVAVLLIAMTGAGAWIASQFKDQILNAVQSEGSSRNNPAGATAAATVIPNTTQPPAPAPATAPAAAPVAASTGDVDQQLQSRGMWVAIKQEFPDWYQARVAEVVRLSAEQKDQAEINRYLIGEIVLLRRENAKHALAASTARHKELAAAFLANLKQLAAESGDGCYEFISKGEASAPIVSRMNDPAKSVEIEAQVVAVVGAIVEGKKQPAEHAAPVKTDYDVLAGELGRLGWTQADMQLFANPKELAKAPRDRVCNMLKDWFTAHLAIQDPSTQERLLFETLKPVIAG